MLIRILIDIVKKSFCKNEYEGYLYNVEQNVFLSYNFKTQDNMKRGTHTDFPRSYFLSIEEPGTESQYTLIERGAPKSKVLTHNLDRQVGTIKRDEKDNSYDGQFITFDTVDDERNSTKLINSGKCLEAGVYEPFFNECSNSKKQNWLFLKEEKVAKTKEVLWSGYL